MTGLVRVPAVCHLNNSISLLSRNMGQYEISPVEPLHDIKGHIKNIWEIFPTCCNDDLKEFFENELNNTLGKKNTAYLKATQVGL